MTRQQREWTKFFKQVENDTSKQIDKETTMYLNEVFTDLIERFSEVEDYRKRVDDYEISVLLTCICIGLLWGENDIHNIAELLGNNIGKVRRYCSFSKARLPFAPSDSTLLRVIWHTNWLDILAIVNEWSGAHADSLNKHFAVDGKAIRAALEKCFGGTHPPYILNAFDVESGCLSAQIEVGKKTNELGEMENLFSLMDLEGDTITIDAAGTHPKVMATVHERGGHTILPVKGNQEGLMEALRLFIDEMQLYHPEYITRYSDSDNGIHKHGRIDYRDYLLITEGVDDLLAGTSFEGLGHSVGMAIRKRQELRYDPVTKEQQLKISEQTVIYISDWDSSLTVESFARYVRNHWAGSEMFHYVLDVEFDEDLSRIRTGNGMQNLSALRKLVVSILKILKKKTSSLKSFHTFRMMLRDLGGCVELESSHASADVLNAS